MVTNHPFYVNSRNLIRDSLEFSGMNWGLDNHKQVVGLEGLNVSMPVRKHRLHWARTSLNERQLIGDNSSGNRLGISGIVGVAEVTQTDQSDTSE